MPISHYSKVFAVKEMKIAKLLTDPAGGSATYGTSVTVVGAKALTVTGTISTKYLRGDNTLLDSDTIIETLTATFNYAKLNLDMLAVMLSAAVVDSGSTPNQLATWGMKNTDSLNYFRIEGRAVSADIPTGDVKFSLWKCKLSALPATGLTEEDYTLPTSTVTIVPRVADAEWIDIVIRETAAALT